MMTGRVCAMVALAALPLHRHAAAQDRSATLPAGVIRGPSAFGITEYRLTNGLTVLLSVDHGRSALAVGMRYHVGRYDERAGERGIAHLLEHLAFTGTTRHPDLRREIVEHGADVGASTSAEETQYGFTVPATREALEWALDVEADRMTGITVSDSLLEVQRRIVFNEVGLSRANLERRVRGVAFELHPYADVGQNADLSRVTAADVRAFYARHYAPGNAVLTIDGSFDQTAAIALIAGKFGRIPRGAGRQPPVIAEPPQAGERLVTAETADPPQVLVAYRAPHIASADYPALELAIRTLLSPNGRVRSALVTTGLAATANWQMFAGKYPDLAIITAAASADTIVRATATRLREVMDDVPVHPLRDDEIDATRQRLTANTWTASASAACVPAGDWRLCPMRTQRLRRVTNDDVRRASAQYLVPANRTTGINMRRSWEPVVLAPPDVDAAIAGLADSGSPRYTGERFEPTVANIEGRVVRARTPAGLEIVSLRKATRDSTVTGYLSLDIGDAASLSNRAAAAEVATRMLLLGTRRRSGAELRETLERFGATLTVTSRPRPTTVTVDPFIDLAEATVPHRGTGVDVQFSVKRSALSDLLDLIAEVLREPAFDTAAFEQLRRQQLLNARQRVGTPNPDYVFDSRMPFLPAGHPERALPIDDRIRELERVTLAGVRELHGRFYGASSGRLVIVGEHDPDSLVAWVEATLGAWRAPSPPTRRRLELLTARANDTVLAAPASGQRGEIAMGLVVPVGLRDDDYAALVIANSIFGGSVDSRLFNRVREREGLSYSVRSRLRPRVTDRASLFRIEATYALAAADRVRDLILEELNRALTSGFTDAEVRTAKRAYLSRLLLRRASDAALAEQLMLLPVEDWAALELRIARLTAAEVSSAFRRYVDPATMTTVRMR